MPDRGGGPTGPRIRVGRPSRRVRTLLMTLGVLAVLAMAFVMFAGFWTDWLWYRSVAYSSVFTTTLWTKIGLFLVFGLLMALAVGVNIWLAHRLRPPLSAMSLEQQSLDRYRMSIAPYKKWVLLAVTALVGLIAGASAVRPVAHLADVGQRRAVRAEGPAVQAGRLLLRLRPAVVPLPARLRLRRGGAVADRGGADPLPLRRAADHQPRRARDGRGHRPSLGAARRLRLAEGRGVLARPVRPGGEVQRLQGHGQLDRSAVRRRQRLPPGEDDPVLHRRHLRRAVLRDALAPHLAAAR